MNRTILVDEIAAKNNISKKLAGEVVDQVFDHIVEAVKAGTGFTLIGFGSFTKAERKAREGRNPLTGAPLKIAASVTPKFKPGVKFKNALK